MATRAELAAQLAAMEKDAVVPVTTKFLDAYAALDALIAEMSPTDGSPATGAVADLINFRTNIAGYKPALQAVHNRYSAA